MSQMWFGNEQHFQWVPEPASGMQSSHVGYGAELEYQSGRKGIVRSMQTHKEYEMNFPVQEAAGLSGLDVFTKYASGFYGDLDDYPLFFADCMNYDQNLFPEGWASPGLNRRGWAGIAEDAPRTYTNYALNPSVELDATGWAAIPGTGGTAAGARNNAWAASGGWAYAVTWSVATSAVSGGLSYSGLGITLAPGSSYGALISVRSSKIQRVQAFIRFLNGSNAVVGSATSAQVVLAANTGTEIRVPLTAAPATTVSARIEVLAVSGTSAANWANGDSLRGDAVAFYTGSNPGEIPYYFDGDSINARWVSAKHSSRSDLVLPRSMPTVTNTPANSYNLPPIRVTWNIISIPNAYPTGANTFGEIPYALIPIPPGYTLHIGYSGSATGTGQVVVEAFNTPVVSAGVNVLTPLSETGAQRTNLTVASTTAEYVKVYIRRTSYATSTVTIASMVAQLWPTGAISSVSGNHIEGKGHRGLKFTDTPAVESYVLVDPYRTPSTLHYKGMSSTLIEAQDKG